MEHKELYLDNRPSFRDFRKNCWRRLSVLRLVAMTWILGMAILGTATLFGIDPAGKVIASLVMGLFCALVDQAMEQLLKGVEGHWGMEWWQP